MKKLEAIIRPEKLTVVRNALAELGLGGLTVTHVHGHGTQRGITQQWRGTEYSVDLLPKVKLEMVIRDELVEKALSLIKETAETGQVGDGKVFISTIDDAMRVRTGERGVEAI